MKELEKEVIKRIVGSTSNIIDRHKCLAALAYAKQRNCEREALKIILEIKGGWLNWLTITQRKWQSKTRNINRAVHHDSIALREKYVRCNI